MKSDKNKILQIILLSFGLMLIVVTYFLYPQTKLKQTEIHLNKTEEESVEYQKEKTNVFENVEYKGFDANNNSFVIVAKNAHTEEEDPNLIYMRGVKSTFFFKDGRVVVITSETGTYDKVNNDMSFQTNIKITDGIDTITADNADFLSSKSLALIYDNIEYNSYRGLLKADNIHYDLQEKILKISMNDDKKIKMKLIK